MAAAIKRCAWSVDIDPAYESYHDTEWGVPVREDRTHFEFLVLESAQAGQSWWTILRKRDAYRNAFDAFDPKKVAAYDRKKIVKLMGNTGIVRNKLKIEAAIKNAKVFLEIQRDLIARAGGSAVESPLDRGDRAARRYGEDDDAIDRFAGLAIVVRHGTATPDDAHGGRVVGCADVDDDAVDVGGAGAVEHGECHGVLSVA